MIGGAVAGAISFSSVYFVGMGVLFLGMILFHFYVKSNKLDSGREGSEPKVV